MMPHTEQMSDSGAASPPPPLHSPLPWRPGQLLRGARPAGLLLRLPTVGLPQEAGVPGWEVLSRPWARSARRVCLMPCHKQGRRGEAGCAGAHRGQQAGQPAHSEAAVAAAARLTPELHTNRPPHLQVVVVMAARGGDHAAQVAAVDALVARRVQQQALQSGGGGGRSRRQVWPCDKSAADVQC